LWINLFLNRLVQMKKLLIVPILFMGTFVVSNAQQVTKTAANKVEPVNLSTTVEATSVKSKKQDVQKANSQAKPLSSVSQNQPLQARKPVQTTTKP